MGWTNRIKSEVIKIDRQKKVVEVLERSTGRKYIEQYDVLILSPGAAPVQPAIPGIESSRIFSLRNVADMDRIADVIDTHNPRKAVVVGAGYIGLELGTVKSRISRARANLKELLQAVLT